MKLFNASDWSDEFVDTFRCTECDSVTRPLVEFDDRNGDPFVICFDCLQKSFQLASMEKFRGCEGGNPNEDIPARPFMTGKMRASSVSIVDKPIDPHCRTSSGDYLSVDFVDDTRE